MRSTNYYLFHLILKRNHLPDKAGEGDRTPIAQVQARQYHKDKD